MELRPYQQAAVDAALAALASSTDSIVIDLPTGSGKSHVIAAIAAELHERSKGKRVLCLAPSKELVEQNAGKYRATGAECSIWSASAGEKCLKHPVVFGSPISVKNALDAFCAFPWSGVVIDECHGTTPTVKAIVERLREQWPNLRVIGTTATPYRLGSGYIYAMDTKGKVLAEDQARDPWFRRCVYSLHGSALVEQQFLTPPVVCETGTEYDTSGLVLKPIGKWDQSTVKAAFQGKERLTATIMREVAAIGASKQGVLVFAATVRHAQECLSHLPPDQAAIVTGKTPSKERAELLDKFLSRKIKFLVNVAVLSTGFDAPHVDMVALLRKTESVGLLQQVVGRTLRLSPGKTTAAIYDYAGNIEQHCPDGDVFSPTIQAGKPAGETTEVELVCAECGATNVAVRNNQFLDMDLDESGFVMGDNGRLLLDKAGYPIPGHYARRCNAIVSGARCTNRFVSKTCDGCGHENDITARYCEKCKAELIDPNRRLKLAKKLAQKREITETLIGVEFSDHVSKNGNPGILARIETTRRRFYAFHLKPTQRQFWAAEGYRMFQRARTNRDRLASVTYKPAKSGYRVVKFGANK